MPKSALTITSTGVVCDDCNTNKAKLFISIDIHDDKAELVLKTYNLKLVGGIYSEA